MEKPTLDQKPEEVSARSLRSGIFERSMARFATVLQTIRVVSSQGPPSHRGAQMGRYSKSIPQITTKLSWRAKRGAPNF